MLPWCLETEEAKLFKHSFMLKITFLVRGGGYDVLKRLPQSHWNDWIRFRCLIEITESAYSWTAESVFLVTLRLQKPMIPKDYLGEFNFNIAHEWIQRGRLKISWHCPFKHLQMSTIYLWLFMSSNPFLHVLTDFYNILKSIKFSLTLVIFE
jgi:hypothetical protein